MDIWKGAILGNLSKHRDYIHNTFYEHLEEAGAVRGFRLDEDDEELLAVIDYDADDLEEEIAEQIRDEASRLLAYWLKVNPITGLEFEDPELYYALVITLSDKDYDYFIPAPGDGLVPSPKFISEVVDEYMENHGQDRAELLAEHIGLES